MMERRSFITGLISLVAAPAIVRAGSLMPVRTMVAEPMIIPVHPDVWRDLLAEQREINSGYRVWISFKEALEIFPDTDQRVQIPDMLLS